MCNFCGFGSTDIFVTRFSANVACLIFSTYYVGIYFEYSYSIAIDSAGNTWAVDRFRGTVYKQVIGGTGWEEVGGVLARDIAFGGPTGDVWIIAQNGQSLHVYRGGAWLPGYYLGGTEAVSIAVDETGLPWFVSKTGQLHSW